MLLQVKTPSVRLPAFGAALVAALVFVPAALAAPAPTKLDLSGPSKAPGGKTMLTAVLTAAGKPLAGKTIALYGDQPTPLVSGATDAGGRVAFDVSVPGPTKFQADFTPTTADAALYLPAKSKTLEVVPTVGIGISIQTYLRAGQRWVDVPHVPVRIRGTVSSYTPGAGVTVDIFKGAKRAAHGVFRLSRAGAKGRFLFAFKPASRGVYRIRVSEPRGSRTVHLFVVAPQASHGSRGTGVRALQSRLRRLGYLTPVDGYFGDRTGRAVLAFRKVNGYARTQSASSAVFRRLARGGGGYRLRYPGAAKHVEFDWSRQVLVLARGARPARILSASSGKPTTPTVFGTFHFYSKTPGFNSHGMYYSNYFIGGYAVHGFDSVPNYPASHGCIRIPIPDAFSVYRWIDLGDPIYVYR